MYYPFTKPERRSFLKTALFLWDSVDFIVPPGIHPQGRNAVEDEAVEMIGRSYVPTESDKKNAHDELSKICNSPIAEKLSFELERPDLAYDFYPEKLLPATWEMLSNSRLANTIRGDGRVVKASTGRLFGYYMMSVVAVCCSHERKRLVTDQLDPYRALANILIDEDAMDQPKEDWHGRLISLTLPGLRFSDVPLQRLIDLRSKEDQLLSGLRRTFVKAVDEAATDIGQHADNPNIVCERIQQFIELMETDLKELKKALRRSAVSTLLSKDAGFSVVTAAMVAMASHPVLAGVTTIGGLSKGLNEYKDQRRKILREHPSSWLFTASSPRFSLV